MFGNSWKKSLKRQLTLNDLGDTKIDVFCFPLWITIRLLIRWANWKFETFWLKIKYNLQFPPYVVCTTLIVILALIVSINWSWFLNENTCFNFCFLFRKIPLWFFCSIKCACNQQLSISVRKRGRESIDFLLNKKNH